MEMFDFSFNGGSVEQENTVQMRNAGLTRASEAGSRQRVYGFAHRAVCAVRLGGRHLAVPEEPQRIKRAVEMTDWHAEAFAVQGTETSPRAGEAGAAQHSPEHVRAAVHR